MTAQLDTALKALKTEFAVEISQGLIVHLGTYNCRRKNNTATGPWSEHAWPNAVDVMLKRTSGTTSPTPEAKAVGYRVADWMRASNLWAEVFWQVFAHYDHVHGTASPRMNFDNKQVPPCAGGPTLPPPPPIGDDDMVLKQVLKGQTTAFYKTMQDRVNVPAKPGDPRYWGSDTSPTVRAQIGTPSEAEWDAALDDFVGAVFQMAAWPPAAPAPSGVTIEQVRTEARAQIAKSKNTPG